MSAQLRWESVKWSDGTKYEGLTRGTKSHGRGVAAHASGSRYMGEFVDNNMEGYGVYVWPDGTLYRGQWKDNNMHGCGVKMSKQANGRLLAEEGEFQNDDWVGNGGKCSLQAARKAAAEADAAAQMARVFELSATEVRAQELPAAAPAAAAPAARKAGGPLDQLQGRFQNLLRSLPKLPKLGN